MCRWRINGRRSTCGSCVWFVHYNTNTIARKSDDTSVTGTWRCKAELVWVIAARRS